MAGAALDVYEKRAGRPPDLLALENVLLIPHLASATTETRTAMADLAADNVLAVLAGQPPADARMTRAEELPRSRCHARQVRVVGCACVMRRPRAIDGLELPAIEKISESQQEDPFQVLIATLLSARTQDATTLAASTRLFKVARGRRARWRGSTVKEIERLIYPVSFYRHKAEHVKATCRMLVDRVRRPRARHDGGAADAARRRPQDREPRADSGAFRSQRNICVDTHVHRISNRLGWVRTRTPDETEQALYEATERAWWPYINLYLGDVGTERLPAGVSRGAASARSPHCPRIGVTRRRERSKARAVIALDGLRGLVLRRGRRAVLARARAARPRRPRRRRPRHRRRDRRRARSSSRPIPTRRRRPWRTSSHS